ncbi:hypothetical protein ACFQ7A_31580 [Streptomyces sp. NPDC056528]|uniref:golvesin C-terminal-like domain-containing protein n=1 Tax=Streptomyces sp. NPDC056528 TaxID=3345854 RepID=UPI00367482A1
MATLKELTGQQGYDHRTHAAGAGTDPFTWALDISKDGTYTAYVKHPAVTGAATAAKYTLSHGTTTEPVIPRDQTSGAATETYVHDDNANVVSRTVKGTSTTFGYDRNRLPTSTTGGVTATYSYNPFGRRQSVIAGGKVIDFEYLGLFGEVLDEKVAGALAKSFQYNPWGEHLLQVKHNTDGTSEDGHYAKRWDAQSGTYDMGFRDYSVERDGHLV